MTPDQKIQINKLFNQKVLQHRFTLVNGVATPPAGMSGFAAQDITDRCWAEAKAEVLGLTEGHVTTQPAAEYVKADPWHQTTHIDQPIHEATAHWHDQNPWKDDLFYVTLEELAECCYLLNKPVWEPDGTIVIYTKERVLENWRQYGDKLDAYVLTGPTVTGGVRYGPEGHEYISPGISLPNLYQLIRKNQKSRKKSA